MADVTKKTGDGGGRGCVRRRVRRVALGRNSSSKCAAETSKVTWPSWKETWLTTMMVFIMVGLTMVFFFGGGLRARLWRAAFDRRRRLY